MRARKASLQPTRRGAFAAWIPGLDLERYTLMKTSKQSRIRELEKIKQQPLRAAAKSRPNREAPSPSLSVKHILVPIDFSDHSLHALAFAEKLARQNGGTLTLLTVVEPLPGWEDVPLAIAPDKLCKEAEARLQKLISQRGLDPQLIGGVLVRVGTPWNEITGTARDLNRDLIVIATHGYTGLKHVLLGSTAERVVRHATCPVLVVR